MMAIDYRVVANVVDIRKNMPQKESDVFFVDTNAWYWFTYSRVSMAPNPPQAYRVSGYTEFIKKALSVKANLYWCGLTFSELTHLIERAEWSIYKVANSLGENFTMKQFRHNYPEERENVVSEMESVCIQLKSMAKILPIDVDCDSPGTILGILQNNELDGYDALVTDAIRKAGIVNVVSDDGDFAGVEGINLFTANHNVIETARNAGKLITWG